MDYVGVEVAVVDTSRAKRGRKLSLCGKRVGIQRTVEAPQEEMEGDGEGCEEAAYLPEHRLSENTLLPPQVLSSPKKTLLKPPYASKSSPQQKQAGTSRRRKAQDKKNLLENGTIIGPSEPSKIAICETFFMPASKKRKLLAEENNVLSTNQGIKRPIEETLTDVPTEVASSKAKSSGLQPDSPKAKRTSAKAFISSSQVPESALRSKAALDAKEVALRSAGKPIHPLFLRPKTSAAKVATFYSEVGCLEPCPPTHVTQCLEEMKVEPEMDDLSFHLTPLIERCKEEELVLRLIQNGHRLKDDLLMLRSSIPTLKKMETFSKSSALCLPNSGAKQCDFYRASSSEQGLENLVEYLQQSTESRKKFLGANVQPLPDRTMDDSISMEKLKERLSWYIARHDSVFSEKDKGVLSSQKNMLWTDVYQPKSSKEVCGNATGVEFLNNWLQNWREKMMGQVNGLDPSQKTTESHDFDSDRGWFEDDSDFDSGTDEESGLCSTLLVTGPTGCGKTAAIYACAAEQGLTVIEVNASSCRSGALLMQKFGRGGLESQAMGKWSAVEDQASSAKEADESRTLPHTSGKISPQVSKKGNKEGKTRTANGSKNSRVPVGKSAVGRKLFDSCALNGCEENLGGSVEETQPGSSQKKKMTVILFEDVDLQFEEDRGFLTSLVQLAKKTKRPIILTSNWSGPRPLTQPPPSAYGTAFYLDFDKCNVIQPARQPCLPQILEKARIDFCYPSPEELTLHASMVCIAEGVACSPLMVNRLVNSCQCDMRKVIMSLQFWRQDACSSLMLNLNSTSLDMGTSLDKLHDMLESSVSENPRESRRRLSLRPCIPSTNAISFSPAELENRWSRGERVNAFREWDSEARYLYDLDIHHIILPDVFCSNFPCLLSLEVSSRIDAAVSELEKQESMDAVKNAEQQGLVLQAQLNAADAERKAERRAKDALRRASRMKTKGAEDQAAVFGNLPSNNDTEGESAVIKLQSSGSPVRSVRKARALAYSPLRPKKVKPKRGLLLCDSDDDDGPQAAGGQADDHNGGFSVVSDAYSGGIHVTDLQDSNGATPAKVIISDDLEDRDVMVIVSCESVAAGKRKRLQQDLKSDLQGSKNHSNMGVLSRAEIGRGVVNLMAVNCSKDLEPVSSDQILSSSPFSETDMDEKLLSDGRHSVTGSTQRDEDFYADQDRCNEHIADLETNDRETRQTVVNAGEANLTTERVVLDVDLNLVPCLGDTEAVGYADANNVNQLIPEDRQPGNTVENSCGLVYSADTKEMRASGDFNTSELGSEIENVIGGEMAGCLEEASTSLSSLVQFKVSGDVEAEDTTNLGVLQETTFEFVNPVEEAWKALRDERQELRHLLRPVQTSTSEIEALATLLDVISASNSISSCSSESQKIARTTFIGTWNGGFEGNIGHCSFWESCQEIASQLVRTGLQTFSRASQVTCRDNRLPVALGILSAVKDVPAVGKCIVACDDVESIRNLASQLRTTEHTFSKEAITRQSERQERLDKIIRTRFLPKARIAGVSLLDYIAYLARINYLEEERRTRTISDCKRSRRFQHHLSSRLSDADIAEFGTLCRFVRA